MHTRLRFLLKKQYHSVSLEKIFEICSRKYTKMFKTDSFLGNKKLSLNQNVWRDHATMQQDVLLHFWVIFLYWIRLKYEKNILLSSSRPFSLSTTTLSLSTSMWGYIEKSYKMQQMFFLTIWTNICIKLCNLMLTGWSKKRHLLYVRTDITYGTSPIIDYIAHNGAKTFQNSYLNFYTISKHLFLMAIMIFWIIPITWLKLIFQKLLPLLMCSFEKKCVSGICEFECNFIKTLATICCMYVLKN